jgi:hypothetical protein
MAFPIDWKGWKKYSNTGEVYRLWEFVEPVEALQVLPGDPLHDIGPRPGQSGRFYIERKATGKGQWLPAQTVADAVFGGVIPRWAPPVEYWGRSGRDGAADLAAAARDLSRATLALIGGMHTRDSDTNSDDPKIPPQPRGVYMFRGAGRWGRDTLVAFNSKGEVAARRDLISDESPGEVAGLASELQRELDHVDPEPPEIDHAAAVEAFLANMDAAPVQHEPAGKRILRNNGEWMTAYRLERYQKSRPRECGACGREYRPGVRNTRRCADCCEARRKVQ